MLFQSVPLLKKLAPGSQKHSLQVQRPLNLKVLFTLFYGVFGCKFVNFLIIVIILQSLSQTWCDCYPLIEAIAIIYLASLCELSICVLAICFSLHLHRYQPEDHIICAIDVDSFVKTIYSIFFHYISFALFVSKLIEHFSHFFWIASGSCTFW